MGVVRPPPYAVPRALPALPRWLAWGKSCGRTAVCPYELPPRSCLKNVGNPKLMPMGEYKIRPYHQAISYDVV